MARFWTHCWLALGLLTTNTAWAAHAYAQFGDIRYPAGFAHFSYVNPAAPKGGEIVLVDYVRFQLGEGIEKEEVDFAAEVAATLKG